jgi:rod shape-determining protein MreD
MIRTPSGWMLYGTLAAAIVLALLPLPDAVGAMRPYVLAMLMVYWAMEAPNRVGLGNAFLVGLLADLALAAPLGEQALRLVVLVYLVQRFRARLRFFPLWQQAIAVGLLLLNDRVIATALHMAMGLPPSPWSSWLSPLLGMLLWPWLFVLLDMARLRARN